MKPWPDSIKQSKRCSLLLNNTLLRKTTILLYLFLKYFFHYCSSIQDIQRVGGRFYVTTVQTLLFLGCTHYSLRSLEDEKHKFTFYAHYSSWSSWIWLGAAWGTFLVFRLCLAGEYVANTGACVNHSWWGYQYQEICGS